MNASPSPILLGPRIVVYTYSTPSHLPLLREHFLPSFPFEQNVNLHVEMMPQECATGDYMAAGWNQTMLRKLELCITAAGTDAADVVAVVDCDVRWYGSLLPIAEDVMAMGRDQHMGDVLLGHFDLPDVFCAGAMFFRPTRAMHQLFSRARYLLGTGRPEHDQDAVNHAAVDLGIPRFASDFIWSHGIKRPGRWEPGLPLPEAPAEMILHHANWCVGVENKGKLLREIAMRRSLS